MITLLIEVELVVGPIYVVLYCCFHSVVFVVCGISKVVSVTVLNAFSIESFEFRSWSRMPVGCAWRTSQLESLTTPEVSGTKEAVEFIAREMLLVSWPSPKNRSHVLRSWFVILECSVGCYAG